MNEAIETRWGRGWLHLIHCKDCYALMDANEACTECGWIALGEPPEVIEDENGQEHILGLTLQGASAYAQYAMLGMMRQEWERPPGESLINGIPGHTPSQKAVLVILFCTLFESLIEQLFEAGLRELVPGLRQELLKRYSNVPDRLERLYKAQWGTTFWQDMDALHYGAEAEHIKLVLDRRNQFVHRHPEAIDDALVAKVVEQLDEVLAGWTVVFNQRCAWKPRLLL